MWRLLHICPSLGEGSLLCGSLRGFLFFPDSFHRFRVFKCVLTQWEGLRTEDVIPVQFVKPSETNCNLWFWALKKWIWLIDWILHRVVPHTLRGETKWFSIPNPLCCFHKSLAKEIKQLGVGITCLEVKVSILLYADDIILMAENENDLQKMSTCADEWRERWCLSINPQKTEVMEFRKPSRKRTEFQFCLGTNILEFTDKYCISWPFYWWTRVTRVLIWDISVGRLSEQSLRRYHWEN